MTTERTRRQAADLHTLANRLTAELDAALDLARACRPGIPSSFGTGSRSVGSHADPTGDAALDPHRHDDTARLWQGLTAALARLEQAITSVNIQLDRCKTVRTERQEANDLDRLNGLDGCCDLCTTADVPDRHWHTGQGDDRLRRVPTGERDHGEPVVARLCNACRMAWERRPYSEHSHELVGWDEWAAGRVAWLKRERVAS